jgi:hypothetical protein
MSYRLKRILALLVLMTSLAACQSRTSLLTPPEPTATRTTLPTASPTSEAPEDLPTPETKTDDLRSLLEYVSPAWVDSRGPNILGADIRLFDVAQMRLDLNIASEVTGVDDSKAKIDLLLGVNSQGFPMAPIDIKSPDAFKKWGWDIADVDQVLYFGDDDTAVVRGDFSRPEIGERLVEQGYRGRTSDDFTLYNKDEKSLYFAQSPNLLIISSSQTVIESLIERKANSRPGLDQHPIIESFMEYFDGAWGVFMAPRGDIAAYKTGLATEGYIHKQAKESIKHWFDQWQGQAPEVGWDVTAIGWRKSQSTSNLTFLYHYSSSVEAEKDAALLKAALSTAPALVTGGTWSDLLKLQSIKVNDRLLVAIASTTSSSFVARAQSDQNWTFLPVRKIPASQTAGGEQSVSGTEVTELRPGWLLYRKEADGFAIALPDDWVQFDLSAEALDVLREKMRTLDPQTAATIEEQARRLAAAAVTFYAFHLSQSRPTRQEVTAIVFRTPNNGMPLEVNARGFLNQFRAAPDTVGPVEHQRVKLPSGEAERFVVHQKLDSTDKLIDIAFTHYLFVTRDYVYLITLAADFEQAADYAPVFEEIAQSFQFVK